MNALNPASFPNAKTRPANNRPTESPAQEIARGSSDGPLLTIALAVVFSILMFAAAVALALTPVLNAYVLLGFGAFLIGKSLTELVLGD